MFHAEKGQHKTNVQKAFLAGLVLGGQSYTEAGAFCEELKANHTEVKHYVDV